MALPLSVCSRNPEWGYFPELSTDYIVGMDLLLDFSYHPTLGPAVWFLFLERNFKQSKGSVSTLILLKDDSTSLCEAVSLLNSGAEFNYKK